VDFSLTEEQQELSELARRILSDRMTLAHLKERDNSDDWYDADTWREFAKANLLGIAIPETHGGLGLGLVDLCLVLREVGRTVAPLPAVWTLVAAALPIARFGSEEQQAVLSQVASGDTLLTAAFQEYGASANDPQTTARRDGDGWRIDGTKTTVPAMHVAESVVVSARTDDGKSALFVVPVAAKGITASRQQTTGQEPAFEVTFDGVRVDDGAKLGGDDALDWTVARVTVALCAVASGVADEATRITAHYTTERKQFERAIGTFQAVGQRMADCFIDNRAIELTMLQAATHLDEGRDVPAEVATAKFWASDGGSRIGHAALHVHGGISIDLDYSIHRYFLWLKQIEFTLGSATPQLVVLGKYLADTPA
jgi:alkylation response protein AidB-like acyl-CoA dehydrogenase